MERLSWKGRLLAILFVIAGIAILVVTLSSVWYGEAVTLSVLFDLSIVLLLVVFAIVILWDDGRKERVDGPIENVGLVMLLFGVIVAVLGFWYLHLQRGGPPEGIWADLVSDFYANLSVESIGVGIAILIINRLYEQRSKLEKKKRIIEQMGSSDADRVKDALTIITNNGWLRDGSLKGVNLKKAKLEGADLKRADLVDANLRGANLVNADLRGADLGNAKLGGADLGNAKLGGAVLEDVTYDAKTIWPEGFDPVAAGAVLKEYTPRAKQRPPP